MFTNNYQALLERMCTGDNATTAMYKNITGQAARDGYNPANITKNSPKIHLGTGTTPPKKTDYVLETPLDDTLVDTTFAYQRTQDFTNENSYSQLFVSATNKSSEQLTANECALYISGSLGEYMIAREVFDTPKVFEPGETKSFVWKIFY